MIKLINLLNEIQVTNPKPKNWPYDIHIDLNWIGDFPEPDEIIEKYPLLGRYKISSKDAKEIKNYFQQLDEPDFNGENELIGKTIIQAVEDHNLFDTNFYQENLGHIISALWPEVQIET